MLRLLNPTTFSKNLKPVSSMVTITKSGDFHEEGLFSEEVFGAVGSNERRMAFAYVELHGYVVHPSAYRILMQLDRKIEKLVLQNLSTAMEKDLIDLDRLIQQKSNQVQACNYMINFFINTHVLSNSRYKIFQFCFMSLIIYFFFFAFCYLSFLFRNCIIFIEETSHGLVNSSSNFIYH